ncbi:MAG TPA: hypothetical protein PKY59_17615 [Pyrinomonadaceae bacterium]|nr:hypothetical protein [Pyrinomonadaceae bacterium]
MNFQNKFTLILCVAILLFVSIACSSSADTKCTGEVVADGKSFSGKGKDADEAQRNSCNLYCLEADSEVDARYRIWLDSPKSKEVKNPSKKEAMYRDKTFLDYVTVTCMNKCVGKLKDGSFKGAAKCQ